MLALPENRADDIQAEARALARAANASVYSPQLVASKYGSQPFKVFRFLGFSFVGVVGFCELILPFFLVGGGKGPSGSGCAGLVWVEAVG